MKNKERRASCSSLTRGPVVINTDVRRTGETHIFGALPLAATVVCLTYAVAHAWWALRGTPAFVREESVFVGGWLVFGVGAVAAVVSLGIGVGWVSRRSSTGQWVWCGVGCLASVALAAYCMLWLPRSAQLLMVPFGEVMSVDERGALVLEVFGTVAAVLTVLSTKRVVRALRSACVRCGRVLGRSPESRESPTSRSGYIGAYLAVSGLIIRWIPVVIDWLVNGVHMEDAPGGWGFLLFLFLTVLAGLLLPLVLVHRWGRIWPRWVPFVAGRPVPRLLVLGPGLILSVGLLAYFGAGAVTATIMGKTSAHPVAIIEIGAYILWGIGLAIACVSYAGLTRPPCHHGPYAPLRGPFATGRR